MDTRIVWAALAGGACATAGAGIVTVLRVEPVALPVLPEVAAAPQRAPAGTIECAELDALLAEVRSLREDLASRHEDLASRRDAASSAAVEAAPQALHGELRELRAMLERRAPAAPWVELDLSSTGPRRAELLERSSDPEVDHDDMLSKRYLLWTLQRALDEFGAPDRVQGENGGMEWTYTRELATGERLLATLVFSGGYVTTAYYGFE